MHGHTRRVKRHVISPEGMQGAEVTGSNLRNVKSALQSSHGDTFPVCHQHAVVALHSKSKIFIFVLGKEFPEWLRAGMGS